MPDQNDMRVQGDESTNLLFQILLSLLSMVTFVTLVALCTCCRCCGQRQKPEELEERYLASGVSTVHRLEHGGDLPDVDIKRNRRRHFWQRKTKETDTTLTTTTIITTKTTNGVPVGKQNGCGSSAASGGNNGDGVGVLSRALPIPPPSQRPLPLTAVNSDGYSRLTRDSSTSNLYATVGKAPRPSDDSDTIGVDGGKDARFLTVTKENSPTTYNLSKQHVYSRIKKTPGGGGTNEEMAGMVATGEEELLDGDDYSSGNYHRTGDRGTQSTSTDGAYRELGYPDRTYATIGERMEKTSGIYTQAKETTFATTSGGQSNKTVVGDRHHYEYPKFIPQASTTTGASANNNDHLYSVVTEKADRSSVRYSGTGATYGDTTASEDPYSSIPSEFGQRGRQAPVDNDGRNSSRISEPGYATVTQPRLSLLERPITDGNDEDEIDYLYAKKRAPRHTTDDNTADTVSSSLLNKPLPTAMYADVAKDRPSTSTAVNRHSIAITEHPPPLPDKRPAPFPGVVEGRHSATGRRETVFGITGGDDEGPLMLDGRGPTDSRPPPADNHRLPSTTTDTSYKYITVRESVPVIQERLERQAAEAERRRQMAAYGGATGDTDSGSHHYYATIGSDPGYEVVNDDRSGEAAQSRPVAQFDGQRQLYEAIDDRPNTLPATGERRALPSSSSHIQSTANTSIHSHPRQQRYDNIDDPNDMTANGYHHQSPHALSPTNTDIPPAPPTSPIPRTGKSSSVTPPPPYSFAIDQQHLSHQKQPSHRSASPESSDSERRADLYGGRTKTPSSSDVDHQIRQTPDEARSAVRPGAYTPDAHRAADDRESPLSSAANRSIEDGQRTSPTKTTEATDERMKPRGSLSPSGRQINSNRANGEQESPSLMSTRSAAAAASSSKEKSASPAADNRRNPAPPNRTTSVQQQAQSRLHSGSTFRNTFEPSPELKAALYSDQPDSPRTRDSGSRAAQRRVSPEKHRPTIHKLPDRVADESRRSISDGKAVIRPKGHLGRDEDHSIDEDGAESHDRGAPGGEQRSVFAIDSKRISSEANNTSPASRTTTELNYSPSKSDSLSRRKPDRKYIESPSPERSRLRQSPPRKNDNLSSKDVSLSPSRSSPASRSRNSVALNERSPQRDTSGFSKGVEATQISSSLSRSPDRSRTSKHHQASPTVAGEGAAVDRHSKSRYRDFGMFVGAGGGGSSNLPPSPGTKRKAPPLPELVGNDYVYGKQEMRQVHDWDAVFSGLGRSRDDDAKWLQRQAQVAVVHPQSRGEQDTSTVESSEQRRASNASVRVQNFEGSSGPIAASARQQKTSSPNEHQEQQDSRRRMITTPDSIKSDIGDSAVINRDKQQVGQPPESGSKGDIVDNEDLKEKPAESTKKAVHRDDDGDGDALYCYCHSTFDIDTIMSENLYEMEKAGYRRPSDEFGQDTFDIQWQSRAVDPSSYKF